MLGMASDGLVNSNAFNAKEMAIMHYVTPRKLLAADQRAEHEKLDRMVNAGAVQDIVDHFRLFIDKHFEILRRKQTEMKYLAAQPPMHINAQEDVPEKLLKQDNTISSHDHHPTKESLDHEVHLVDWEAHKQVTIADVHPHKMAAKLGD